MEEAIINFLQNQSVMTICYVNDGGNPYSFPCFFTFNPTKSLLYFKTSSASYHCIQLNNNPEIAGSILPDKLNIMGFKGVQFRATVLPIDHLLTHNASRNYYQRFPLALVIPGDIYTIQLNEIKMTDSTKVFGKKITWKRKGSFSPTQINSINAIY